jgi:hypothetical protein
VIGEASAELDELSSSVIASRDIRNMRQELRLLQVQIASYLYRLSNYCAGLEEVDFHWEAFHEK